MKIRNTASEWIPTNPLCYLHECVYLGHKWVPVLSTMSHFNQNISHYSIWNIGNISWSKLLNSFCNAMPKNTNWEVYTVAVYSWFIANNFVIGVYCRCIESLCQIVFSSIANYFRSYSILEIKPCGLGSRIPDVCSPKISLIFFWGWRLIFFLL